ncbi:aminotransferase class V-fold PLP-dependent enzyme [Sandaracinomonas limnophila]|uniref:Aminotransferase class V-fold PLP-dependent enzyme n=1 Tax=Sandaracinomonas limnophila TaxID=1862386 RepID=A0A437PPI9_9BACT|nr:aminotransferase class V-fold PLP-dependent enzyme [Sandaracinomonas limnophila]RVU24190.1 aminotransferase class V-fold PLP-dependent enzyme [Sandaracinomonas limnophila]
MKKRTFLQNSLALMGFGISNKTIYLKTEAEAERKEETRSNDFWQKIRSQYNLQTDFINLESGYYNIIPQPTLEKYQEHIREVNRLGAYYMRTVQHENKQKMVEKLAHLLDCPIDELIITRNTTESLDMVIGGYPWQKGDEAVFAYQDYGAMQDMFDLMVKKHGIVNKRISIPNHPKNDEELVDLYAKAITSKTKLLMIPHIVNITGQILPVRKICDMAHEKGVEVMVDGAHAVAHFQFSIKDLHCDYYGSSLHKWLAVPLGAGILHIKKQHIEKIWPLLAETIRASGDISKLNHTGTHPVATDLSIADAIDFYNQMGPAKKEERLRHLQNYWTSKVRNLPHIILNTPKDPSRSCAIANVGVKSMKPSDLAETLLKKYKIFTVAIDHHNVQGCRITPNVFTTEQELDQLVEALKQLA